MRVLLLSFICLFFLSSRAQKPTVENIGKALKSTWEKPATSSTPRQSATIHSIKIGSSAKANVQDKIDGIPPDAAVTIAQIDFTVREYYSDQTQATHRLMTAKVYKDQFGEWAVKSNGMKILENKSEPAK
jgi:hypothetical protein